MRIKKTPSLITIDEKTDRIAPFRTLLLDAEELSVIESLELDYPSVESEQILKNILDKRGMGHLMDSDKDLEKWSGYVILHGNELWLI